MEVVVQESDQLLKELADRLKNPSKMFGVVGPKAPAGDTEKLKACIETLKAPLHGAIHYRQLKHNLEGQSEDADLKELDAFIGEKPLTGYGYAPYKNLTYNYLLNMKVVIKNLLEPEKNIECVSFARIKNLIQNSMKGKNIGLSSLADQINQTLAGKPRDAGENALLTPERAARDTTLVTMAITKRVEQSSAKVNKPLFGGKSKLKTKKRKTKKTRKSRRV